MSGHKKVFHQVPAEQLTFLQLQKLGRHQHKLPNHLKKLCGQYPKVISDYFLRHLRIAIELRDITVHEQLEPGAECSFRTSLGKIGFAIDRTLMAEVLECYYGGVSPLGQADQPVSSSEERMNERLGAALAQICLRMLFGPGSPESLELVANAYEQSQWEYRLALTFVSPASGTQSMLHFHLDGQLVNELTQRMTAPTHSAPTHRPARLIRQVPVRLNCVLVNEQLSLARAMALRPGDILLVRLPARCDVRINQQKLFQASICERDGSLLATSLVSVKTP